MAIRPNQYAKLVVSLAKALSREIKMNEEEKTKATTITIQPNYRLFGRDVTNYQANSPEDSPSLCCVV